MIDAPNQRPSLNDADGSDSDPKPAENRVPAQPGSLEEAARTAPEPEAAAREAIDRATAPVGADEER